MRIYLAASYSRRLEVEARALEVWALTGHIVASTWHDGHHESRPGIDQDGTEAERAMWAKEDLSDIGRTELLILCADLGSSGDVERGGHHFEAGYALAFGCRLAVVGQSSNVFYALPEIQRYESWPGLLHALEQDKYP